MYLKYNFTDKALSRALGSVFHIAEREPEELVPPLIGVYCFISTVWVLNQYLPVKSITCQIDSLLSSFIIFAGDKT